MRFGLLAILALAFVFASFSGGSIPTVYVSGASPTPTPPVDDDEDEVIRIGTEVVNVLFTVQDRDRRLLTDIRSGDVEIYEDGELQEIIEFNRQVDLPLSLAILIDASASQERTLPEQRNAAKIFLESVVRPSKDEVAVISFTGESTLEQGMTSNLGRLQRAIDRVRFVPPSGYIGGGVIVGGRVPGTPPTSGRNQVIQGSTAIWDAIWITADEILGPAPEKTRRAIILLSDGVNTFGKKQIDDAIAAAQRSEAVIYAIGIGDNFYSGIDAGALRRITERTGGRAYFPRDDGDLRRAFNQIQVEMRSQFLISYEPTNQRKDGSYRKIEIKVKNPELQRQRVTVTHRDGYFAKTDQ
jgi:Ca-activated chloride channel homolog